jgi:hypothetical protein
VDMRWPSKPGPYHEATPTIDDAPRGGADGVIGGRAVDDASGATCVAHAEKIVAATSAILAAIPR